MIGRWRRLAVSALAAIGVCATAASPPQQQAPGSSVEGAKSLSAQGALVNPRAATPPPAPPIAPPIAEPAPALTPPTIPSAATSAGEAEVPSPPPASAPVEPVAPANAAASSAPPAAAPAYSLAPAANPATYGPPESLPEASGAPLTIDFAADPVIRFAHHQASSDMFRETVARAVEGHPAVREAQAQVSGARAVVRQAQAGLYPTLDLSITADHSLSRGFGDDNNSLIERLRPRGRTDAEAILTQNLLDFGATARRIKASRARVEGAQADVDTAADQVAMNAISAWYDLSAYRALVAMATSLSQDQSALKDSIRTRIAQGLSATSDLARIETYTTNADARLAQYRRSLAEAEARYTEAVGLPAPQMIDRPILPAALPATIDAARLAAHNAPEVRSAEAAERAARADYGAATAALLPHVQGVVDAGRYGVLETQTDYDVRGRLVLSHRLFGGGVKAERDQAEARALQARAAADRVGQEAERDAAIGFSDLQASQEEVAALEEAYKSNRQARDAIAERFRVTQGNLIDVLNANDSYFQIAASYIQAVTRADAERLVLLQREGALLTALGVRLPDRER